MPKSFSEYDDHILFRIDSVKKIALKEYASKMKVGISDLLRVTVDEILNEDNKGGSK